ncbi:MAG: hypothetical protein N7Q72_02300, partial [Spiroplasma sp. Tabriz.8]|nr:hypothetical protein [Spiroplasma sp. Tabriz.8]
SKGGPLVFGNTSLQGNIKYLASTIWSESAACFLTPNPKKNINNNNNNNFLWPELGSFKHFTVT